MRKISLIVGILIIIIGMFFLFQSINTDNQYKKEDEEALDVFFDKYNHKNENIVNDNKTTQNKNKVFYVAAIEVPSISLKTGIVMSDKTFSSMDRSVSIYPTSDFPDVAGGNFVLFAHSGNSRISYFKNIYKLNTGDEIRIYYNNNEYTYKVIKKYKIHETDDTPLHKMKDKTIISLITCDKVDSNYRTVVVGELI